MYPSAPHEIRHEELVKRVARLEQMLSRFIGCGYTNIFIANAQNEGDEQERVAFLREFPIPEFRRTVRDRS